MSRTIACPFCEGDIGGCCFCDHSGRIDVGGENDFFKSEQAVADSIGVKFLKDMDRDKGTEAWPEMIEYFLDENNIPEWYKNQTLNHVARNH